MVIALRCPRAQMTEQRVPDAQYAKTGPLADLSRAGRPYYSAVAAEWLRSRRDTAKRAGGEG